jgi:hypothetical protein
MSVLPEAFASGRRSSTAMNSVQRFRFGGGQGCQAEAEGQESVSIIGVDSSE